MKISGIYKIESKLKPERCYIGSAVDISKRWRSHLILLRKNQHNKKIQNHFNKYNETDLRFSILLGCEKKDLIKTEQYFIDSYNPWFNVCKIAGSTLGIKASDETKKLMSEQRIGNKHSLGYHHSEETKQGMSRDRLGKKKLDKTKYKGNTNGCGNKGKPSWRKGKVGICSEETRRKTSKKLIGRFVSEETRQIRSESMKLVWAKKKLNKAG